MGEVGANSLYVFDVGNACFRAASESIQAERILVDAARKGDLEASNFLLLRYQDLTYNGPFRTLLHSASIASCVSRTT